MELSFDLNLGDGVVFTRFCFLLILICPLVSSLIIYFFKIKSIKRTALYFFASIALNYIIAFLFPMVLVFGLILFGTQAEVATLYALFFVPLLMIFLPINSFIVSKKY